MSTPKSYICRSELCSLGVLGQPGRFTGGSTALQRHLVTGAPLEELVEGEDYGLGFCPNCGQEGKAE